MTACPTCSRALRRAPSLALAVTLATSLTIATARPAHAIAFADVSTQAGIDHSGPSWGAAWGDFNGDGLPDVWVSNHHDRANLYLNAGDGTFVDIAGQVLPLDVLEPPDGHDAHGAAWADPDNDGDQDLLQVAAGGGRDDPNHFYVNVDNGVSFIESAAAFGIDLPEDRGHTPLWLDWDQDGLLDLILTSTGNGTAYPLDVYRNEGAVFTLATDILGLYTTGTTNFALATTLAAPDSEVLAIGPSKASWRAFSLHSDSAEDLTADLALNNIAGAVDAIAQDLDGDLYPEIYIVRGEEASAAELVDPQTIEAHLTSVAEEQGFAFTASDIIDVFLHPEFQLDLSDVFIGAGGYHPASTAFTLDAADINNHGIVTHFPGVNNGIYVGLEEGTGQWQILFSSSGNDQRNIVVRTAGTFDELTPIGFEADDAAPRDFVFRMVDGAFAEQTDTFGISERSSGVSIASGDFDNDMDLDVYIVATGPVLNESNILYENQDGVFVAVPGGGGAGGVLPGRGDSVAVADYDQDGYLDLFTTNGKSKEPFHDDGPQKLYRNLGGDHHWLEIDLEGVAANRDGVGASVWLSAGGITQLREQGNGMHFRSQNHQRLHFGLGPNTRVDTLTIEWPGGLRQELSDIAADQILRVLEPAQHSIAGQPKYVGGVHEGVYVWKDTFDGPYRLRVSGDADADTPTYRVRMLSGQPPLLQSPYVLPRGLPFQRYSHGFDAQLIAHPREYGLDFALAGGDRALLAVERDGVSNPRLLQAGASGLPLTPAGWILDAAALPTRPDFAAGTEAGLFAGLSPGGKQMELRWNGGGNIHNGAIHALSAEPFLIVNALQLDPADELIEHPGLVTLQGSVNDDWKGIDAVPGASPQLGIAFEQAALFNYPRVNPQGPALGTPNAVWLPRCEPYNAPEYDRKTETGFFLWQAPSGEWRVRATAGTASGRYTGTIVSDQPFTTVEAFNLENDDTLDTSNPAVISFDFQLNATFQDGVHFTVADGATLSLDLSEAVGTTQPATSLAIGEQRWPVAQLPLDLSGW